MVTPLKAAHWGSSTTSSSTSHHLLLAKIPLLHSFFYFYKRWLLLTALQAPTTSQTWTTGGLLNMGPLGASSYPGARAGRNTVSYEWDRRRGCPPSNEQYQTACNISQHPVIQDPAHSALVQRHWQSRSAVGRSCENGSAFLTNGSMFKIVSADALCSWTPAVVWKRNCKSHSKEDDKKNSSCNNNLICKVIFG